MKKFQLRTEVQQHDHQRALQYLSLMELPAELENMPHSGASLHLSGKLPLPPSRTMRRLFKKSSPPWTHHLVFLALVLATSGRSPNTVHAMVLVVQKILNDYKKHLIREDENKEKKPDLSHANLLAVFDRIFGSASMTDSTKTEWLSKYRSAAKSVNQWFIRHKDSLGFNRTFYEDLLIPMLADEALQHRSALLNKKVVVAQQAKRKEETGDFVNNLKNIYVGGNVRLRLFERFYEAAIQAESHAIENKLLTYGYYYNESDTKVHCKIVHINFILEKLSNSSKPYFTTSSNNIKFSDAIETSEFKSSQYFVNICNAHELDREKFWFIELVEAHVFYDPIVATRKKFDNFCKIYRYESSYFFQTYITRSSRSRLPRALPAIASEYLHSLYLSHHELMLIFSMAAFAAEFLLTSGARINELLQVALHPDVLKKIKIPRINKPIEYIEKYAVLLIPKGQDEPQPFFLPESAFSALNTLSKVASRIGEIYEGSKLISSIEPNRTNAKYHLLEKRAYIFQVDGKHLNAMSLTTMIKLLLHNLAFTVASDGRLIPMRVEAHIFRHGFATHAVNIENAPLEVVAKILNQKHLPTTAYYSEPTLSMIAHHQTNIAENMLHHLNLDEEAKRHPTDIVVLYETAKQTSGTLTEVLGGTCTAHGECAAKSACIGCGAKVPDPAKRAVIERKMDWAKQEKEWNHREGLGAEERKMDILIRDCKTELWEMDQIELYQNEQGTKVHVFDSESVPLKWVKSTIGEAQHESEQ